MEPWHCRLRRARLETIDPETGKGYTQESWAEFIGVNIESVRRYEQARSFPCRLVRMQYFRLVPSLNTHSTTTVVI